MVLGTTADQLADLRAKDEAGYKAHLSDAQWCEWKVTVQTKGHEYKGERKLRHQVGACRCVRQCPVFAHMKDEVVRVVDDYSEQEVRVQGREEAAAQHVGGWGAADVCASVLRLFI